jgi:hypothetical protein
VDVRERKAFMEALGAEAPKAFSRGTVAGLNYSNGHAMAISLYTLDTPAVDKTPH